MAVTDQLVLPAFPSRATDAQFATFVLNETTDYYAVVFVAPESLTITQLGCSISAVSGSPNLEISLQGVSSGLPDGTIKSSGNAKAGWAAATGWTWQTLTSSYAATAGEQLAFVVKLTSGTSATLNVRISGTPGHPCGITFDNATTTTTRLGTLPVWGAKGSGTTWCWGQPVSAASTTSITNASTIESGMEFTLPAWISSAQIGGARILGRWTTAATSVDIGIYSGGAASDTTRAQVVTVTGNDVQTTGTPVPITVWFPPVTISGGSSFRLSTRVTAGTYNEYGYNVSATEDLLAYAAIWGNQGLMRTRRTTGNWTDSNTNLVFIEPIAIDVTTASGGTTVIQPGRRQIWTPRQMIRPVNRSTVIQQTTTITSWVPIPRTLVRAARAVRTRAPAATVPVPVGVVANNVYVPVPQPRRLAIRERHTRRSLSPTTLTTVTPGPTAYVPLRSTTKHLRPAHVVRRLPVPAVLAQQAAPQTIVISAPRIVR